MARVLVSTKEVQDSVVSIPKAAHEQEGILAGESVEIDVMKGEKGLFFGALKGVASFSK
jgi:hypothetical protein